MELLRNPKNQPPAWAKELMDQATSEPTFLKNTQGDFAALFPIKLQAQCLLYHGPGDQIPAKVREALSQRYANDQEIGYLQRRRFTWMVLDRGAEDAVKQ